MMSQQLEPGKLLHKRLIHILICGMKQVPVAGAMVEMAADWWKFSDELRQDQQRLVLEERVAQLEEAMAITPEQARAIALEMIAAERQQGQVISEETAQAVTAIAGALPANIRERTQATLRQARRHGTALHTVLPLTDSSNDTAQREFYRSLLPMRRPRFQENEAVPYGPPQWRLIQLIGSGGFGEVWEARHQQLGDRFAIKFCQDSVSTQTLQREAEALKKLRRELPEHPHIVRLVDLQLEQEPYWLAFEYVSGGTLEALMRAKTFTWQEALQVFIPVLQGMSAVHSLHIVHRDLKPANILLDDQEVPKITDFGIGKVLIEQEQQRSQTRFTMVGAGSLGYAPPEQLEGEMAHPTDDVYALAVILWQLLTHSLKSPRYVSATLAQLEAPKEIKDLLLNCLERPRLQRPQQAGELLSILQPLVPTEDLQRVRAEVETLEQELATLESRLSAAASHREVAQQLELEREKLRKQQELARKELQERDLSRQAGYQQALEEDKQERAQLEQEASVRLARLRQQVEEKRQAWAKTETPQLQPAIEELLAVEKSLADIDGQYAQEKQMQLAKLERSLQQALQELGEFKPAPRDRFEYQQEYEARLVSEREEYEMQQQRIMAFWQQAQQKMVQKLETSYQQTLATLQQQQQVLLALRFEVPPADLSLTLTDYRIEEEKLMLTLLMRNFWTSKQVQFTGEVSISRDLARECWQHPELLLPDLVLKLDSGGRLAVGEVGFETTEGTRYLTDQATVIVEDDQMAIWKRTLQANTLYAYQQYISRYSQSIYVQEAERAMMRELRNWWSQLDSKWKTIFGQGWWGWLFSSQPSDEELKKVLSLQELNVSRQQLSDLEPLRGLTQLRGLWVGKNQFSETEIARFKEAVPGCEVYGW